MPPDMITHLTDKSPSCQEITKRAGTPRAGTLSAPWRNGLIRLSLFSIVSMVLLRDDWAAMAGQWWHSSTYTHMLLVPAIIVWLVFLRARELTRLTPHVWWPGLGLVALALALWMAGHLAGLAEASEAGCVALLVAGVPALLGVRVSAGLAFPLFYMVFLVPVGDEMIPLLQMITARLTVALVHLSQIRATIDGVFIATPAGLFEVAEACSGVKFLTAMVAFGALAANVCFIRWQRRLLFVIACIVVPVLANGVRAWATIYVAQFIGANRAGGFDHIVYGWFFFAMVIAMIIAGGWRWFDRPLHTPMIDPEALLTSPVLAHWERGSPPPLLVLTLALGMVTGGLLWAEVADNLSAPMPAHISLPDVAGWHRVNYAPLHAWQPRAAGASHRLLGRYQDSHGDEVDVFFALYASQGPGHKAGGFGEGAIPQDSGWAWQAPGPAAPQALSQRLLTAGPLARLAETTYRTGDLTTGSTLHLRLANLIDKLLLRRRSTMVLILSAEEHPSKNAATTITAFRRATGPLNAWMDSMTRQG